MTTKHFHIFRWAPMNEHSKFVTFTYMGGNVGTLLSYPIYGLILDQLGWEVYLQEAHFVVALAHLITL